MKNPFEFFGLLPTIDIDVAALRKLYLDIQRGAHPDLVGVFQTDVEISEQANTYYKCLQQPLSRVKAYIESVSEISLNQNVLPKDFLMDMMDLSDSIQEMDRSQKEQTSAVEAVLNDYFQSLDLEFEQLKKVENPSLDQLQLWYQKSQYLNRLRKNFEGIEEF
jgi:Fe-S protein assembly co-chaperone HscB